MRGIAQMTAHDVDELCVAFGGPYRGCMANDPEQKTWNPKPQSKRDRRGERAVGNGDSTRRAAEQDWVAERATDGRVKAGNLFGEIGHQITAPPPNEKNDKKKLDAANAIARPNTICIKRRKPPPAPRKAGDKPVGM